MKNKIELTRQSGFILVIMAAIILHAVLVYQSIGPFNLFTDSGGYLMTFDNFSQGKGLTYNVNRPVGLPLLYFGILSLGGGGLKFIVIFQIIIFTGALFFLVSSLFSKFKFLWKLLITFVLIFFSTRTFVYTFMILSEALFSSALFVFIGAFFRYIAWRKGDKKSNPTTILLFLWAAALSSALIKSVGIIFIAVFIIIFLFHTITFRSDWKLNLTVGLTTIASLLINYYTIGTFAFSKQDGIQWLISANSYINYETNFMSKDKLSIKDSHKEILLRYHPRTRLDQMIGPVDGLETPSQILLKNSSNYDEYNEKIRNIIFEGLLVDSDWIRYGWSGFDELYKVLIKDTKEGFILPLFIDNNNKMVLDWLPALKEKNTQKAFLPSPFSQKYYKKIVRIGVLPKYVSVSLFITSLFFAFLIYNLKFYEIYPYAATGLLLFGYLYISVLMVFALDRYFVGVETVFLILSTKLFLYSHDHSDNIAI